MKTAFLLTGLTLLIIAIVLSMNMYLVNPLLQIEGFTSGKTTKDKKIEKFVEHFYNAPSPASTGPAYEPIGPFDGIELKGSAESAWRATAPNEPLKGPAFQPGPDSLFMFKNNQCKPECCGASFSCGSGCVCTTPEQRQYIASRGGNRGSGNDF
jgi:hypothetical protein